MRRIIKDDNSENSINTNICTTNNNSIVNSKCETSQLSILNNDNQ